MAPLVNVFLQLGSLVLLQRAGGCPETLQSPGHCGALGLGSHRVTLEELAGLLEQRSVAFSQMLPATGDTTGRSCAHLTFSGAIKSLTRRPVGAGHLS